jgi:hypothetical protein
MKVQNKVYFMRPSQKVHRMKKRNRAKGTGQKKQGKRDKELQLNLALALGWTIGVRFPSGVGISLLAAWA